MLLTVSARSANWSADSFINMDKILISAIQIDVKNGDVERNISTALDFIEKAAHKKSKIIVLPEMWATGFSNKNIRELSEQYFKKILDKGISSK